MIAQDHMNHNYTFTIEGDPIPWARPRSNKGRFYDSQSKEKEVIAFSLMNQNLRNHGSRHPILQGPLHLTVIFYMKIPKCSQAAMQRAENTYHAKLPDLSNLIKFIEDTAQGILFPDDSHIAQISACKKYSRSPRTVLTLSPLGEIDDQNKQSYQ